MNKLPALSLNLFIVCSLFIAYFFGRSAPGVFWPGSFLGFVFPYLAIMNCLAIVYWLFAKRLMAFISLAALIITSSGVLNSFSLPAKQSSGKLRVMTYNVKNFDLYNWSKNKETRIKMLNIIENEKPDIICFQEFFTNERAEFDNIKKIHEEFGYKYFHYEEATKYLKNHWGAATFSKYPIVGKGKISFEDGYRNMSIFTDVKLGDDTIRIYNLHLQSYYMDDVDYAFLKSLSDLKVPESGSWKNIIRKMKSGFYKRSKQAEIIADHFETYTGKKIVCGDFNDVPVSYSYRKISDGMKDSFRFRGLGMGKTFVSSLPSLRIDYILVDQLIEVEDYKRLPYKFSDHYPLLVSLSY